MTTFTSCSGTKKGIGTAAVDTSLTDTAATGNDVVDGTEICSIRLVGNVEVGEGSGRVGIGLASRGTYAGMLYADFITGLTGANVDDDDDGSEVEGVETVEAEGRRGRGDRVIFI